MKETVSIVEYGSVWVGKITHCIIMFDRWHLNSEKRWFNSRCEHGFAVSVGLHCGRPVVVGRGRTAAPHAADSAGRLIAARLARVR